MREIIYLIYCRFFDLPCIDFDEPLSRSIEMRHSVTTRAYRARKVLDSWLSRAFPYPKAPLAQMSDSDGRIRKSAPSPPRTFPRGWLSLYTMVRGDFDITHVPECQSSTRLSYTAQFNSLLFIVAVCPASMVMRTQQLFFS